MLNTNILFFLTDILHMHVTISICHMEVMQLGYYITITCIVNDTMICILLRTFSRYLQRTCWYSSAQVIIHNNRAEQIDVIIFTITVWHKKFTWNLILRIHGQWENGEIKICKLDRNYIITTLSTKLDVHNIKISKLFIKIILQ